jgi:hypothetical protein
LYAGLWCGGVDVVEIGEDGGVDYINAELLDMG